MTTRTRRLVGPCLTLATIAALRHYEGSFLGVSAIPAILLTGVVFSSFVGGVESGLVSAVLALAYAGCSSSIPGRPFHFDRETGARMAVWTLAMPTAAVLTGILRRRLSRTAVPENDERFRMFVDGVRDYALIMLDPQGRVAAWNAGAERILGYSDKDAIGLSCEVFCSPGESTRKEATDRLHRAAAEGRSEEEGWRVRKNGARFEAHSIVTPLWDGKGRLRGFSEVMRDMTERKSLQAQLAQAQKLDAIGRLSAGVAHDFNNALTVILGYADLLLTMISMGSPEAALIREIRAAGKRAGSLTRQLLTFGRQQQMNLSDVDPNAIIARMGVLLGQVIPENVHIETVLQPNVGAIHADPNQIEQALLNLVINARDSMPRGGRITIETAAVDANAAHAGAHVGMTAGPHVMIAVSDTGCGMPPDVQAHLFEPFFTTKGPGKGNGLGLAMVHGTIKQHHGHVWVYSEVGRGTSIKLYFPRIGRPPQALAHPNGAGRQASGNETILLVEDSEAVRRLTREVLRKGGYMVLDAAGGEEALKVCREHAGPIHLLLTDYVMPQLGGLELARRAVELRPGLPVLCVSGYNDRAIAEDDPSGVRPSFLGKPFTAEALLGMVRSVLDGGSSR